MRYLVAIPIFNEAATVRAVLRLVRRYSREILVVDDGSTDETPRLLGSERRIHRIRHPVNLGYGRALHDAFDFAGAGGYEWLITMDCDEQHEPHRIPDFLQAAARRDTDIISGSRYLRSIGGNSLPPPDRRTINRRITGLLNELLGLELTDAFCGFKAYRVSALKRLDLTVAGYGMPLQLWVQAARRGLRIREIPVRLIYNDPHRHFGGSLDDPDARLRYYYDVLGQELGQQILGPERLMGPDPARPAAATRQAV